MDVYLTSPLNDLTPFRIEETFKGIPVEECSNEKTKKVYQFVKKIGVGGFSNVYEVRNRTTGKLYAMKVVKNNESADKIRQVTTERHIIEQLDHPFIVKMHSCFTSVFFNIENQAAFRIRFLSRR